MSGVCDSGDLASRNLWIFNLDELYEYYWDDDNNGLELLQLRFYETTSGEVYSVP